MQHPNTTTPHNLATLKALTNYLHPQKSQAHRAQGDGLHSQLTAHLDLGTFPKRKPAHRQPMPVYHYYNRLQISTVREKLVEFLHSPTILGVGLLWWWGSAHKILQAESW